MRSKKVKSDPRRFRAQGSDFTVKKAAKRRVELSGLLRGAVVELSGDHSSSTHPWPKNKPGQNWIEKKGGKLPSFIKRVAKHIMADSGYSQSHAIAAAINQCKKGRLGPKGLAAAAQWEALKAA